MRRTYRFSVPISFFFLVNITIILSTVGEQLIASLALCEQTSSGTNLLLVNDYAAPTSNKM